MSSLPSVTDDSLLTGLILPTEQVLIVDGARRLRQGILKFTYTFKMEDTSAQVDSLKPLKQLQQ